MYQKYGGDKLSVGENRFAPNGSPNNRKTNIFSNEKMSRVFGIFPALIFHGLPKNRGKNSSPRASAQDYRASVVLLHTFNELYTYLPSSFSFNIVTNQNLSQFHFFSL